jgi:hypothetical protein
VSNLSHDLRSPLTATVACLETLDGRWGESAERADDRRLVEIALRNTRNAARLVQSLGDLAKLDEPEFGLRTEDVDAGELLDDIAVRFAERAASLGIALSAAHDGAGAGPQARARVDVELFERAVANLVDNAAAASCWRRAERGSGSRSASATMARAFPSPTCRSSSTVSTKAGRTSHRPPATAGAASAWPSSSASPNCTMAT